MSEAPRGPVSRRSFLNTLLGVTSLGWLGTVLFPIVQYFRTPTRKEDVPTSVVAAKIQDLKPNEGIIFKFGASPALLVLGPDGRLRAFSAVCTHLECTVKYRPDMQKIHCACHNGIYDLNGRNISGPPPRPLTEYRVVQKGDDVIVFGA